MHPLDNPVWSSLTGPHRDVAERAGPVARYRTDVSSFGAFDGPPGPGHWRSMAELVGPGGVVILTGPTTDPPDGWTVEFDGVGVQLTGPHLVASPAEVAATRPDVDIVRLGPAEADEMVALVELTRPGPFSPHTHLLGGYVGVRRGGTLVAMAGQRFRLDGWCEISAVATHPGHRRRGLGELLVRAVAAGIAARGEAPVLHASADNAAALRLYRTMGFTVRRRVRFVAARAPGGAAGTPAPVVAPVHG